MTTWLFLLFVFVHGAVIAHLCIKKDGDARLASAFIFGSLASTTPIYLLTVAIKSLNTSLILFFCISLLFFILLRNKYIQAFIQFRNVHWTRWCLLGLLFIASYYLFSKAFGYDSIHGNFLIASHVYMDMGAHIPFIRSFSMGNNIPFAVPFFAEKSIFYYPLFDFYTGLLEKYGMRIDIAYNFLSSLTLISFIVLLYKTTYVLFRKKSISILTVFLFFFPSTLQTPLLQTASFKLFLQSFWHITSYNGSGPLGENTIQVFWYFNTFLNQRPLLFGLASLFLFVFMFLQQDKKILTKSMQIVLGTLLGFLALWHTLIYTISFFLLGSISLQIKYFFKYIPFFFISLCIGVPAVLLLDKFPIVFKPGFVLSNTLSLERLLLFWGWNLGVGIVLIPLGFIFAKKNMKLFFVPIFLLFIVPNLFQLAPYMYDNHKFFSIWIIFANMLSALALATIWNKKLLGKILTCIFLLFYILPGLCNFLVIKNDVKAVVTDYPRNSFMTFVKKNLPNDSIIFTNGEIYDPTNLVGKKTYLGRVHFIYTYGVSADTAIQNKNIALLGQDKNSIQILFKRLNIRYAVFYKNNFAHNTSDVNINFYKKNFTKIYEDTNGIIFKI
ncbi:MAG TPA: hypothetical protein VLB73_02640 [Patescibacteria group bacterium]|nr:hypothetical protein [Patescibacteria group bacterium]